MNTPKDLLFSNTHEWVKFTSEGTALVGLTEYAQEQLGDVAFINLCDEGEGLAIGDVIGDIESIKAVTDVYSPINGKVIKVNDALLDNPEQLNSDPYGSWLVELEDIEKNEELMKAGEYKKFIAE
ncbi:MAG TPA: glycine cleavage system protein GcvH [Clostridia bacterium]|nr:glycine cleavage system protein GcvH [Clostridia bacterium]